MPPKPTAPPNPTTRDLEEAIAAQQQHTDDAIAATHTHFTDQLNLMNTKLDNQQHTMDSRDENLRKTMATQHETLTKLISEALRCRTGQPSATSTVNTTTVVASGITSPTSRPQPSTFPQTLHLTRQTTTQSPSTVPPLSSTQIFPYLTTALIPTQPQISLPPFLPYQPFSTASVPTPFSSPSHHTTYTQPIMSTSMYPPPPPFVTQPHPSIGTTTILTNSSPYSSPLPAYSTHSNSNPHSYSQSPQPIPVVPTPRNPKIEMSTFDGTDALDWLFQADQFFSFYNIVVEQRLAMAAFYMKGEALSWYKWMFQNNQLTDWNSFAKALELRFGPSTYENHQAELFKLKQLGSVAEYQATFEKIGNQVRGLPHEAMLNCFISGLLLEIRNELAIQKPSNIS
jgi:hypothetical protein